jgi:hypothetical protein
MSEVLTLDSLNKTLRMMEDMQLSGLPPALLESWGRDLCLKLVSCEQRKDSYSDAVILFGGRCELGELFMLRGDTLYHFPPLKWPEATAPKLAQESIYSWPYLWAGRR